MAISDNYSPDVTQGNGSTLAFTGNWSPLANEYMVVVFETIATGALSAPKVLDTDYELTFTSAGYTVDFTISGAPPSTVNVIRYRDVTIDQSTPYTTARGYQGAVLEASFDKLTAIVQQIYDGISRSLSFQIGSSSSVTMPEPVANNLLGWNAAGDNLENKVPADIDLAVVTPFIETLFDDADAATARATLGVYSSAEVAAAVAAAIADIELETSTTGDYAPSLTFNGNAVGMTFADQKGRWVRNSLDFVTLMVDLVLTAKGSSTGNATVSLPFAAASDTNNPRATAICAIDNINTFTGTIMEVAIDSGASVATLRPQIDGSSTPNLAETYFANNSIVRFTITYKAAPL